MGNEKFMMFDFPLWHKPVLLNFLYGVGNFGKIWSVCRQYEIHYSEWRM